MLLEAQSTMPAIRPISDLRNRAREIARLCHTSNRPVFITRNGESDLVVMSQAHYNRLWSRGWSYTSGSRKLSTR